MKKGKQKRKNLVPAFFQLLPEFHGGEAKTTQCSSQNQKNSWKQSFDQAYINIYLCIQKGISSKKFHFYIEIFKFVKKGFVFFRPSRVLRASIHLTDSKGQCQKTDTVLNQLPMKNDSKFYGYLKCYQHTAPSWRLQIKQAGVQSDTWIKVSMHCMHPSINSLSALHTSACMDEKLKTGFFLRLRNRGFKRCVLMKLFSKITYAQRKELL